MSYLVFPRHAVSPQVLMMVALKYEAILKERNGQLALGSDSPDILVDIQAELGETPEARIVASRWWDQATTIIVPEDAGDVL